MRRRRLNHPDRFNPLSAGMFEAIKAEFVALRDTPEIREVLLSGSGLARCAGQDLREISAALQSGDRGEVPLRDLIDSCAGVMQSMLGAPRTSVWSTGWSPAASLSRGTDALAETVAGKLGLAVRIGAHFLRATPDAAPRGLGP